MKIMIIEDEKNVRLDLSLLLQSANYETTVAEQFVHLADQVMKEAPDLVLLDVTLPNQNGFEVCRQIRQRMTVPIIFLTSDGEISSEIQGMLLGADDYLTKPFHPSLLLARIAAVLKRAGQTQSEYTFTHKGVTLEMRTFKLSYLEAKTEVTKNECRILGYLMQHKGEIVPRLELIDYLWDNEVYIDDSALSVTVTRLRNKLEEIGVSDYIETKRGAGYRI